jgi:hypothetical protein
MTYDAIKIHNTQTDKALPKLNNPSKKTSSIFILVFFDPWKHLKI